MAKQRQFLGVPLDLLTELGKVTVASARVESVARSLSIDLGIRPKGSIARVLDELKKRVRSALPEHARVEPDVIITWIRTARSAMDRRGELMHSVVAKRLEKGDWVDIRTHIKSGTTEKLEAAAIESLVADLKRIGIEGQAIHMGILKSPRQGVYLRNTIGDGSWVHCVWSKDYDDPKRPTEDELDTWWRELGPWNHVDNLE